MSTFRVDRWWDLTPAPWIVGYTVRITNATQAVLPMVHLRVARSHNSEVLHRVRNLAPGATVALPAGTMHDIGFYEIVVYDELSHALARLPHELGAITPIEAASAQPFRPNDHTDEWQITDADLLDANASYVVEILNSTPDTWDEVTVFYSSSLEGTVGLSSSAVSPTGKVTFNLGAAGAMDGYTFAIWVDGLRAWLGENVLRFPETGLMTAQRSASLRGEMNPTLDFWQIGDDQ